MIHTKEYWQAYADFLLSERRRHEEDIRETDRKLGLLYSIGITEVEEAPWMDAVDIFEIADSEGMLYAIEKSSTNNY
jgi:hypothetical protein